MKKKISKNIKLNQIPIEATQHTVAILVVGNLSSSCETTTSVHFTGGRLSVCLSVCQCGLMYWSVLLVYLSVFQSVSPFVGEPSHRAKCLNTHQDLTNIGLWSLFEGIFGLKLLTASVLCWRAPCLNLKTLAKKQVLSVSLRWGEKRKLLKQPRRDSKTSANPKMFIIMNN